MKYIFFLILSVSIILLFYWYFEKRVPVYTEGECIEKGGRIISAFDNPEYNKLIGVIANNQGAMKCVK